MSGVAPEILVDGAALTAASLQALVELRAERGLRSVGTITLRFTDPGYALASKTTFKVGVRIEVGVVGGGVLAGGAVTGLAVEQRDGLPPELVVTAHDDARLLTGSPTVRTFTNRSFRDVLAQVAGDAGLGVRTPPAPGAQPHVLQVGTDLEFVDEIADRLSWDWWMEGKTLVAELPGRGPEVSRALGTDLLEFSVSAVDVPQEVRVHGWDVWKKEAIVSGPAKVEEAAARGRGPLADLVFRAASDRRTRPIDVVRTVADGGEASAVAASLRDSIARAAVTAGGRGPADAGIAPGVALTVTNAGPLSGTYHVSRVEHVYRRGGFHTRFVAGDRSPATLVDLLGGREDVGRGRADTGGRYYGLMSGVVSDLKDPEKRGRARVVFPAISRDQASDWARIATVGAGGNRGLVVIPEVDDEVLVAFEGGDLRRPVILAGLHNGKDKIPEHDVAHGVAHRRFTSRLGHVVELADGAQPAEQHVLLALAGGEHRIRLGKDRLDVEVPSGVPLSIKAGTTTIVVDGSNGLTIEADTIAVKARRQLSLEGPTVQIKATQALDLSAGTNLTVKAAGATSIEADGMTTVKGKAVAIN